MKHPEDAKDSTTKRSHAIVFMPRAWLDGLAFTCAESHRALNLRDRDERHVLAAIRANAAHRPSRWAERRLGVELA